MAFKKLTCIQNKVYSSSQNLIFFLTLSKIFLFFLIMQMNLKNSKTLQNNFIFCKYCHDFEINDVLRFHFRIQSAFPKTLNIKMLLIHYLSRLQNIVTFNRELNDYIDFFKYSLFLYKFDMQKKLCKPLIFIFIFI